LSLDWNAKNCPAMQKVWDWDNEQGGFETLTNEQLDERRERFGLDFAILNDLIWASVLIDAGSITDANVATVAKRIYMSIQMNLWNPVGYYKNDDPENGFIPKDGMPSLTQIYNRVNGFVGLRVNIAPTTDAQWWKRVRKMIEDPANTAMNRIVNEKKEVAA